MENLDLKTIAERASSPTPPFFKKIRNWGLLLTGVAGVVMAAPVALPAIVVTVAGYLATAGGIAATISQITVQDTVK